MFEYGFEMQSSSVKMTIILKANNAISARKKLASFLVKQFKISPKASQKLAEKYKLSVIRFIQ